MAIDTTSTRHRRVYYGCGNKEIVIEFILGIFVLSVVVGEATTVATEPKTRFNMAITLEQQMELDKFPLSLRMLVEAELAAGNSITEVGHSFPAPPVGAYIKLANKVSTRARSDGDGLHFYERKSSIYSGEFTDAKRFYFVLEPPSPPPPELDADAMRKSYEPQTSSSKQDPSTIISPDRTSGLETNIGTFQMSDFSCDPGTKRDSIAPQAFTFEESATGSTRLLYFRDNRPPHDVKCVLERAVSTLFTPTMEHDRLCMRGKANVVGAQYDFLLRFEAALREHNCYSLRMNISWAAQDPNHGDYYRKTSGSWFALWTREFIAANPQFAEEGSPTRYSQLCDHALIAEQHLDSIAAIQHAIVVAMKGGASFRDSHKEGGTNICWKNGCFVRSDYGDYPDERHFKDENEFFKMLYQFCRWDVTRNSGKDQFSEIDTWKLILRRMDAP